jgi:hypothetical protein
MARRAMSHVSSLTIDLSGLRPAHSSKASRFRGHISGVTDQCSSPVIRMDPHKLSVTIEVMTADESLVAGGRFDTTVEGYAAMLEYVAAWPDRVWAIEGCEGIGRHVAHRLLVDGQDIVDVPAKLSARSRVRDRSGPQDGWDRRSLGRPRRHPDGWAASGGLQRTARGAATAGRPAPLDRPGAHPQGQPIDRILLELVPVGAKK